MAIKLLTALFMNAAVFSVLFLLMLPVRRLVGPRLSPAAMLALWAVLAVKLVTPFGFESNLSLFPPQPASVNTAEQTMLPITELLLGELGIHKTNSPQVVGLPGPGQSVRVSAGEALAAGGGELSAESEKAAHPLGLPLLLLGLWAAGALAVSAVLLAGAASLRRRVLHGQIEVPIHVLQALEVCRREVGVRRNVPILISGAPGVPIVMGAARPVLVLPEDAAGLDDSALRHVLAHELMHIRRGDLWALRLMNLLCAIYWFVPPVWLCGKLVRADLETACDHGVLRLIGKSQRLAYISTVLHFNGRQAACRLAAAMGIGDGLPVMEKRITGMHRPSRTSAGGRAIVAAVAFMLLLTSALTACQPSPTKPVVVGKDAGSLEEKINTTPAPARAGNAVAPCEQSFTSADGAVTVRIHAQVEIPASLPVVQVKPYFIPMEQVKAMAQELFHGSQAWEAGTGLTKDELQNAMLAVKRDLQLYVESEGALKDHYNGNQAALDAARQRYEWQIAAYEKLYATAPETVARKVTDWKFHPEAYYQDITAFGDLSGNDVESLKTKSMLYDSKVIRLTAELQNCRAFLEAGNLDTVSEVQHYAGFFSGTTPGDDGIVPRWSTGDLKPIVVSKDDVVAMVRDSLAKMGIAYMAFSSIRAYGKPDPAAAPSGSKEALQMATGRKPAATDEEIGEIYGYSMIFVPTYGGVAAIDTGRAIEQSEDQYGSTYNYERLLVNVYGVADSDSPMITSLQWSNPMQAALVENPNVSVMSLEDALEVFQVQMKREYTMDRLAGDALLYGGYEQYKGRIKSAEIDITGVTLGLVRIRVPNNPGAYRMVPAWVFQGMERLVVDGIGSPIASPRTLDGVFSYSVINAIDGSVIDPGLGY